MEIKILISDSPGGAEAQVGGTVVARSAAPGAVGQAPAATGSPLQPPDYLVRAAAALGAHNGGPAPMLSGLVGGASGEPVQFTSALAASPVAAAMGAPDQAAGAAPGAERAALARAVEAPGGEEEGGDEDEE